MNINKTNIEATQKEVETQSDPSSRLLDFVNQEIESMEGEINPLLELRHELFDVNGTEYSKDMPIMDQLYEDPAYNVGFIHGDMGLRRGGALEYHQTTEKYDKGFSEENAERDFKYRQAILAAAQKLGFVAKGPGVASSEIDRQIGILDSELEPIKEKVAAVVVNGAAGMSNIKRVRNVIRNIESGAIDTDTIILAGGARPVGEAEKSRMKPPYVAGDTEIDSMIAAAEQLLGVEFDDNTDEIAVDYGNDLTAKVHRATALVGDRIVNIEAIEAPYDDERTLPDGNKANRVNTTEVFLASLPLLDGRDGAIVMESHDTWVPWQNLIAHQVFGLSQDRTVYPSGPLNAERVYVSEENGEEVVEITAPQDVLDEMIKTYKQLIDMRIDLQS